MCKLKTVFGLVFAVCVIAGLAHAAEQGSPETVIKGFRFSVKGSQTRLIFDAEGARPKEIGPASEDGISVFFDQIKVKLKDRIIEDKKSLVKEIKYRRESGFFEVLFREKNLSVSTKVEGGKKNKYTLVMELTASGKPGGGGAETKTTAAPPSPPVESVEKPKERIPPVEIKKVETTELFGSRETQLGKGVLTNALSMKPEAEKQPAQKPQGFAETDDKTAALYKSANEEYESCSRNLVLCAPGIIDSYEQALKAGPNSSLAPQATYRMGIAHFTMGNFSKADRLFRQVTSEWPDHPVASRCWLGIGNIYNKKQAFMDAMEAFRWALRSAVEKDDKAAAYFELGKVYQILGANKEALEMLDGSVAQSPDYYIKKPEVYRYIGEARFALGNAKKAKEDLLRYVNYQQSAPDQDVIMAKIAEAYLIEGDSALANKMYAFIHKYFTDSEGDLICRIRQAELIEKANLEQAIKIYDGLRQRDLSPSLRRIVAMKLASLHLKRGDLAVSLELMEGAFPANTDTSGEVSVLRERILCDLIRQYFSKKNFMQVLQLYDKYRRIFDAMKSPDILPEVAESYAGLSFYSNALEVYDAMIAKGQKKGDDMFLRCALYSLRLNDTGRSFQFCKLAQSEALDLKKSEILGHIFYRDQKYAEAVKNFGKVFQKGKFELIDPNSYVAYGCSLYQVKKFDEALPVLQKGMEQAKTDDTDTLRSILIMLGKCYSEQKQYQRAAEMLEAALKYSSEEQKNELLYEISTLYVTAGKTDKAIEYLNQILGASQPFWCAVAQQAINTIQMNQGNAVR